MEYCVFCEEGDILGFIGRYNDNLWKERVNLVEKGMVLFINSGEWYFPNRENTFTDDRKWKKHGF